MAIMADNFELVHYSLGHFTGPRNTMSMSKFNAGWVDKKQKLHPAGEIKG
jgi:hypothetical protein